MDRLSALWSNHKTSSVTALYVTVLCLLTLTSNGSGGDLANYRVAGFDNPNIRSKFNHVTTDNRTGVVYIGAVNAIYSLNVNLEQPQEVGVSVHTCSLPECVNYNKVLLVDYANDNLITCGSRYGTCEMRSLDDIAMITEDDHRVAAFRELSTEAIIVSDFLYVAATYNEDVHLPESEKLLPICSRTLGNEDYFTIEPDRKIIFSRESVITSPFLINYVKSFTWNQYVYFVSYQRMDFSGDPFDSAYVSKISRVCRDSDNFKSYTEIWIECQGEDGLVYNLIQAAHVGPAGPDLAQTLGIGAEDALLYAVFSKNVGDDGNLPSNRSALCIFMMKEIEDQFIDAIHGCLKRGYDYSLGYVQGSLCPGIQSVTLGMAVGQQCNAANYKFADAKDALVSTAVVEWQDAVPSSLIALTHRAHTIVFAGTAHGELLKMHIQNITTGREYERITIGSPVLKDTLVDTQQEHVTILTEKQLLRLKVEDCGQYRSCIDCIGPNGERDGDPYCGWCSLQNRCTRYHDCPQPDMSGRWLPFDGPQCVTISSISPFDSLPVAVSHQQLELTVVHLPDLAPDKFYECIFDDWDYQTTAVKNGDVLSCTSPPASKVPPVEVGDHITAQLQIYSSETDVRFVSREFYFYQCSQHESCVSCTSSRWACNWCVHTNRCTHENGSVCEEDDIIVTGQNNPKSSNRQGLRWCPQLNMQRREILVPVGVKIQIDVIASNLPHKDKVTSYQCALDIEGKLQTTPAHQSGNSTIICEPKVFSYRRAWQELNVSLSVRWNGNRLLDDVHSFSVTLYNCSRERPDCSRCLSSETTRLELQCGWCKDSGICGIDGSTGCTTGLWISSKSHLRCPAPEIMKVFPQSGPYEGNTLIDIGGKDLGKTLSDIISVTIGGRNCSLEGFDYLYRTGNSVSCRTAGGPPNQAADISVTVLMADRTHTEVSTGNVIFKYTDPVITRFFPMLGPRAGGTRIKIEGKYLKTGRNRTASIGQFPCSLDSVTDGVAYCKTSASDGTGHYNFSLKFDDQNRLSEQDFMYTGNPTISNVEPKATIQSGGRPFHVSGTNLNTVQAPQILVHYSGLQFTERCTASSSVVMTCPSPALPSTTRQKRASGSSPDKVIIGFIMDGVESLKGWSDSANVTFMYYPDPVYHPFEGGRENYQPILQIMGENLNVASTRDDVTIFIGNDTCVISTFTAKVLTCTAPKELSVGTNMPVVMVRHSNLRFKLGVLVYPKSSIDSLIIYILAIVGGVLLVFILLMIVVYRRKSVVVRREQRMILQEINKQEEKIRDQARKAFAELQLSVDALASELEGTGMPFLSEKEYATRVLFKGLDTIPDQTDQQLFEEKNGMHTAMLEFGSLLLDKDFIRVFTQTLEEQRGISAREKGTIASLLMVYMILTEKLQYLTDDVLIPLMSVNIAEAVQKNMPKQLFRRVDSIVGKLVSSWVALCLYDFLKSHAAYPLYLLYSAIKLRCFTGPMDCIHGAAHYSLSESYLLREEVEYREMTLRAILNDNDTELLSVIVLDIDAISQVKNKILDVMFKNKPYSSRPSPDDVDLEWRPVTREPMVMKDIDETTVIEGHWKKINTLSHYQIPDGACVALIDKQDEVCTPGDSDLEPLVKPPHKLSLGSLVVDTSTLKAAFRSSKFEDIELDESNCQLHLTKDNYNHGQRGTLQLRTYSMIRGGRENVITDFYFSRQLSTKTTVQNYIDGMLKTVLTASNGFPAVIKRLFDFFDQQVNLHDIEDADVIHIWKSNSLLLRFWLNSITHPDYLFDLYEAPCVEAGLGVIAQALVDACSRSEHKLAKDAPFNKLLFAKDVPRYRRMVAKYYQDIQLLPACDPEQLSAEYTKTCQNFSGMFSKLSTLKLLHEYAYKYHDQLMSALEEDEVCNQHSLADKLQKITTELHPTEC